MIPPLLQEQIQALLAEASPATVPGGLLAWWGRTDFPEGDDAAPILSQQEWEQSYLLLQNAALQPGAVKPLYAVTAATREFRPDGPLPIAIASFRLAVPRPGFLAEVRAAAQAGTGLASPLPPLAGVTQEARAFLASGLLHDQWGRLPPVYRGRRVSFLLDQAFHFTNPGDALPDRVEVDPGDSGGFREVAFRTPFSAEYPSSGAATVSVRCHYGDTTLLARFSLALSDEPAAPPPEETWRLQAPASGAQPGNTGTAYVYRAPGRAEVQHPVIIAEGFPGGYACDYLYEMMNQAGTIEALRAAGYDVILLGFDQGSDLMQRNAQLAEACVREAMRRTAAPLVVGGVSMGGLITRYALAAMEERGEPHQTRIFLTIDTPHRGAYTSLADQWFAHYFRATAAELDALAMLLDSPANQQFVMSWVNQGTPQVSPLRQAFFEELEAMGGYPQQPRRLAVACGRGDGERGMPPHQETLTWSDSPFVAARLWTLPEEGGSARVIGEGYYFLADGSLPERLEVASEVSWEGAPGGQNVYNAQAAAIVRALGCGTVRDAWGTTCAVPTVSALDLDQSPFLPVPPPERGLSPFHDYICCEQNEQHLTLTPEVSAWLLRSLGEPPSSPRKVNPMPGDWNPDAFDPHAPEFLRNPYPTFALFREQAPVHQVEPYGSYWIFRYPDVVRVLDDTETFVKNPPQGAPPVPGPFGMMGFLPEALFSSDPPRHTLLRQVIEPLFREAIQNAPQVAAQLAQPLLAKAKQAGRLELITDYALPLPSGVLFTLLGIPEDDWPGLVAWVSAIVAAHDITQTISVRGMGATCSMALHAYYQGFLLDCQRNPGRPGLVPLLQSQGEQNGLTPEDVQVCCVDLTVAGYLSTTFLIGTGILNLLSHPYQAQLLQERPELLAGAVEEMLRYDAPAQLVDRVAARDTGLGGTQLREGDALTVVLGSANRDLAGFADPDRFLITRDTQALMSFGAGIHHCIGAPLVRAITPVAVGMLLQALPNLRVEGLPQWQADPYLRAVTNLPLAFG